MMMKYLQLFLLPVAVTASALFSSCEDENEIPTPAPGTSDDPVEIEWEKVDAPVAIISGLPDDDFGTSIRERFSNVSPIEGADIAVISGQAFEGGQVDQLVELYDRGGLVVVVNPDAATDNKVEENFDGGYCPLVDETDAIMFAFNNKRQFYTMLAGEEFDGTYEEIEGTSQELLDQLKGKKDENENDSDPEPDSAPIEEHEHDKDHFHQRLDCFVKWINKTYSTAAPLTGAGNSSRGSSEGYDPRLDISNDYTELYVSFPVSLHNKIDQAAAHSSPDVLDRDTEIEYNYRVYPLFLHSCNGGDAPGDYYIVEGSVTAHNNQVWGPYCRSHGWCNDRVIGYYMTQLNSTFELIDSDNEALTGLRFYKDPAPTTTMQSMTYSEGFSVGLNGSLAGQVDNDKGLQGSLTFGFDMSWSKTVEQTLADVSTTLVTDSHKKVSYTYTVCNINNERDWGKIERDYPLLSRNDMVCPSAWVWKVPYGQNGVKDNSSSFFKMKISMDARYGAYNWWRGASWDYHHGYSVDGSHVFELPAPDRRCFGVVALKNAGTATVAHVKIWKTENGKDKLVATIPSSYNVNETARCKLVEGTYKLTFDLVDPNAGNKLLSSWKYDNVTVKMGRDEDSATTMISTVDAVKTSE